MERTHIPVGEHKHSPTASMGLDPNPGHSVNDSMELKPAGRKCLKETWQHSSLLESHWQELHSVQLQGQMQEESIPLACGKVAECSHQGLSLCAAFI